MEPAWISTTDAGPRKSLIWGKAGASLAHFRHRVGSRWRRLGQTDLDTHLHLDAAMRFVPFYFQFF